MAWYQIFSLFLGLAGLFSWIFKRQNINKLSQMVDEDKFERKRLLEFYYPFYMIIISIISTTIWNSYDFGKFIFDNFGYRFQPGNIAILIFLLFLGINWLIINRLKDKKTNKKNVKAIVNSSYKLKPKKLNIGVIQGSFLESKLQTFLSFIVRIDDFTIQKINFDKEGILLKKEYLINIFKHNLFSEDDFKIIEKIEQEINSINDFEFNKSDKMKFRIIQLIRAIQSQKKYTFAFGQIKQYSNSTLLDEIIIFLQEIQENRYSDDSLPYLIIFKDDVK